MMQRSDARCLHGSRGAWAVPMDCGGAPPATDEGPPAPRHALTSEPGGRSATGRTARRPPPPPESAAYCARCTALRTSAATALRTAARAVRCALVACGEGDPAATRRVLQVGDLEDAALDGILLA
eukprot:CAMPEP_0119417664 /NCGR_PEP_ID=MMETSP1335-20130426/16363_1 /TAXON_ID=259385 /ORGANISM="Chrysoculter rhomboideus, Strain RCC1486" /LENGTH=124 /DNA_ID=CAMNT_0007442857 /DNA_START=29 /DNA_END=398 /DNA_ORIENTATION=+